MCVCLHIHTQTYLLIPTHLAKLIRRLVTTPDISRVIIWPHAEIIAIAKVHPLAIHLRESEEVRGELPAEGRGLGLCVCVCVCV